MGLRPVIGGEAMEVDGEYGGVEIGHALCDESGDDAGEDVAGAGGGERGAAGGVGVEAASIGDDGAMSFEDDGGFVGACEFDGGVGSLGGIGGIGGDVERLGESPKLAGMGREDGSAAFELFAGRGE